MVVQIWSSGTADLCPPAAFKNTFCLARHWRLQLREASLKYEMKRILLTTVHRPLGINSDSCTEHVMSEVFHAQVTLAQGAFSIRDCCTGWGLDFIAANIAAPCTVLHYPTIRQFRHELAKGYDYLGISFVICTFNKAIELCHLARKTSPATRIVLGGYGTVLRECDQYADFVCREEGVQFFKKLLGEEETYTVRIPLIEKRLSILSIAAKPVAIIPVGLGCSRGCDFCCTSHFFDRKYVPLLKTATEIHRIMKAVNPKRRSARRMAIVDEDFLADREKIVELARLNAQIIDKPILYQCLTSVGSLSQYDDMELLTSGLHGAWIGIESNRAQYPKLKHVDIGRLVTRLKDLGISVLASMILGYDWHDEDTIEEDFQYLMSLAPTFTQFMLYSPCPQTPLYKKMLAADRLLDVPYHKWDGFHLLFRHPHFSPERLEKLLICFFEREYEELGPSVFRLMEIQLAGYREFRNHHNALLKKRAEIHKELCLEIYPLLRIGIQKAPSLSVKSHLKELKAVVESELPVSAFDKAKGHITPIFYLYTVLKDRMCSYRQPRMIRHVYDSSNVPSLECL